LKEGIFNVNELSRHLAEKSRSIEIEINETFDRLIELVEQRKSQVILELQQREAAKQETLSKLFLFYILNDRDKSCKQEFNELS
jgi:hypothetical protein